MKLLPSDLFELIQSLGKAEKSFVKKASGNNNQVYLELFADLEKLKDYDEKAFLKKHARRSYAGNYRFSKHYLYNFILDALHQLYEAEQHTARVGGWIHKADVLLSKSLYRQAYTLLEKAALVCEEKELFALAVECYGRQYRIVFKGGYTIDKPEHTRELCEKEMLAASKLLVYAQINDLKNRLMIWLRQQGNDAYKRQTEITAIIEAAKQLKPDASAPYKNQVIWQHTMATGHYALQDYPQALVHQRALVRVYSQNPQRVAEEPYNHVSAINNLIILQLELNDVTDIEDNLALFDPYLKGLEEDKPTDVAIKAAEGVYNLRMRYGISFDKLTEAFIEHTVKPFLNAHEKQVGINFRLNFYLHMAFYYSIQRQYGKAQDALMPVLHEIPKDIRTDLHLQARIAELIIHYELGNYDLLPYLMDAVQRKAHGKYKEIADAMRMYFANYLANKASAREELKGAMTTYQAKCSGVPYPIEKAVMAWVSGLF